MSTGIVTILFTDIVGSVGIKQRLGDDEAERLRKEHFGLLREAVTSRGGEEVKTLGDGLMVVFPSAVDACESAASIQTDVNRDARLEVRVGLHVGEPIRDEDDYFGTAVDVAKRLCDKATGGQIVASELVRGLVGSRGKHEFRSLGELELKGVEEPVRAYELSWERPRDAAMLTRTPFVGRRNERDRLAHHFAEATSGRGGLVMLVGEPGIGKTRLAEEASDRARREGALVLWGRCYEGEWTPPYAPFAEAIANFAEQTGEKELREKLGLGAGPIAQLVPAIRERIPDLPEVESLSPDEDRFRLLDAVSQFVLALARARTVLLVLDDLHWADRGTIAMLRQLVRFVPRNPILIVGAYRDVELDRTHPLAESLGELRREAEYDRLRLGGLDTDEVGELLAQIAERDIPEDFTKAIAEETSGVPFFIREVLLHLIDERKLFRTDDGRWTASVSVQEMGIPEGVREVIGRRLSRLSDETNKLMTIGAVFNGPFRLDVAATVAGLSETEALDAVDEALNAQLLEPSEAADSYAFPHALIRHTLEAELNPSRQVRMHRQVAEALEERYGAHPTFAQSAEIAYQYHRSSAMPGGDRGAAHALNAAEHAVATGAHDEAVSFLTMALDLIDETDPRRPRVLGRYAVELAWALRFEEATRIALEAGDLIAEAEGDDAAADYLNDARYALMVGGSSPDSWQIAKRGLELIGDRRDSVWALLTVADLQRRDAEDPDQPGIPLDIPERREAVKLLPEGASAGLPPWNSRAEALESPGEGPWGGVFGGTIFYAGEFRRGLADLERALAWAEAQGAISVLGQIHAIISRCHAALGEFGGARAAYARALAILDRTGPLSNLQLQTLAAQDELNIAMGEGYEEQIAFIGTQVQTPDPANNWAFAGIQAAGARLFARLGQPEVAIGFLDAIIPAIERAPGNAANYQRIVCDAAETLWVLDQTDNADVIERNLKSKVVEPDFRYPMFDGRLSLGRLCAVQERPDEASEWFADGRRVLDEQEAKPLRAIVDHDEAFMYARLGNAERAKPLVEAALEQFQALGMPGWIRRTEELKGGLN